MNTYDKIQNIQNLKRKLTLFLEMPKNRYMNWTCGHTNCSPFQFDVYLNRSQMSFPHQGPVPFQSFKSGGKLLKILPNVFGQLEVLFFEGRPKLGRENHGIDWEVLSNIIIKQIVLFLYNAINWEFSCHLVNV